MSGCSDCTPILKCMNCSLKKKQNCSECTPYLTCFSCATGVPKPVVKRIKKTRKQSVKRMKWTIDDFMVLVAESVALFGPSTGCTEKNCKSPPQFFATVSDVEHGELFLVDTGALANIIKFAHASYRKPCLGTGQTVCRFINTISEQSHGLVVDVTERTDFYKLYMSCWNSKSKMLAIKLEPFCMMIKNRIDHTTWRFFNKMDHTKIISFTKEDIYMHVWVSGVRKRIQSAAANVAFHNWIRTDHEMLRVPGVVATQKYVQSPSFVKFMKIVMPDHLSVNGIPFRQMGFWQIQASCVHTQNFAVLANKCGEKLKLPRLSKDCIIKSLHNWAKTAVPEVDEKKAVATCAKYQEDQFIPEELEPLPEIRNTSYFNPHVIQTVDRLVTQHDQSMAQFGGGKNRALLKKHYPQQYTDDWSDIELDPLPAGDLCEQFA